MAASTHPRPGLPPDASVYVKTDAGRALLAEARSALGLRERQILLLCTGERDAATLEQFFGPDAPAVLARLGAAGLVQTVPRAVASWPMPSFAPTLPPLQGHEARTAELSSGFMSTAPGAEDVDLAFSRAHTRAGVMLVELGAEEAEDLFDSAIGVWQEDDMLAFLARTIALAHQLRGPAPAARWAQELAELLPRAAVPRLVDCLTEVGDGGALAMGLYERLLSDTDTGADTELPAAPAPLPPRHQTAERGRQSW